jgi:NhaP-type Na+/H+ or K+/H+ antiporter
VLALLSDSTNADRPGRTPSDVLVGQTLEPLFLSAPGRIIVATFAVVAFSIFVQGLTMPLLIRRLGLVQRDDPTEQSSHS